MKPGQHDDRTESVHTKASCPELLDYQAAVAEFDRLWQNGSGRCQPERMHRLLLVIEAVEGIPAARMG